MSSRTTRLLASSWVAAALFATGAAHANLVANGGFEMGFDGWTTSLDPLYDGVDVLTVHEGKFAAFFGGADSSASQTLTTVAGNKYQLSFWLTAEDNLGFDKPNSFSVDVDGNILMALTDVSAFGYTQYQFDFVATGATTDLTFNFGQVYSYWDLDSVNVRVPEPGSIGLLAAAGLAGIAAGRRRKTTTMST